MRGCSPVSHLLHHLSAHRPHTPLKQDITCSARAALPPPPIPLSHPPTHTLPPSTDPTRAHLELPVRVRPHVCQVDAPPVRPDDRLGPRQPRRRVRAVVDELLELVAVEGGHRLGEGEVEGDGPGDAELVDADVGVAWGGGWRLVGFVGWGGWGIEWGTRQYAPCFELLLPPLTQTFLVWKAASQSEICKQNQRLTRDDGTRREVHALPHQVAADAPLLPLEPLADRLDGPPALLLRGGLAGERVVHVGGDVVLRGEGGVIGGGWFVDFGWRRRHAPTHACTGDPAVTHSAAPSESAPTCSIATKSLSRCCAVPAPSWRLRWLLARTISMSLCVRSSSQRALLSIITLGRT